MAENNKHIKFRDGTSQKGRRPNALRPGYFAVEERSTEDLLRFAQQYARELAYFNLDDQPAGNWSGLLGTSEEQIQLILKVLDDPKHFEQLSADQEQWLSRPHLVLFLEFLERLKAPQQQFKALTEKHLNFYYQDVLQFKAKSANPDKVHVLFEANRGVKAHRLKKGTPLFAQKDSSGKARHYYTEDDIILTPAQVEEVSLSYREYAATLVRNGKKRASEKELPLFGTELQEHPEHYLRVNGFAITSPLLHLGSGKRTVQFSFENGIEIEKLKDSFDFAFSAAQGEKGWLNVQAEESADSQMLSFTLAENDPSVTPAPNLGHLTHPVFRATLREGMTYENWKGVKLNEVRLKVKVDGLQGVAMRNKEGIISSKADVPFFGSQPSENDRFTFGHPEFCVKPIEKVDLSCVWKDKPENFKKHYQAYVDYGPLTEGDIDENAFKVKWLEPDQTGKPLFGGISLENTAPLAVEGTLPQESPDPLDYPNPFVLELLSPDFQHDTHLEVHKNHQKEIIRRIEAEESVDNMPPVNPPYHAIASSIEFDYTASETLITSNNGSWLYQQQEYLQSVQEKDISNGIPFFPRFTDNGFLYIGLKNLDGAQDLDLLFQLSPRAGGANTEATSNKIEWSYLDKEGWIAPGEEDLPLVLWDHTDDLLRSGIIRFQLPEVNKTQVEDYGLRPGLFWLRAEAHGIYAGADLIGVHAQAARSQWRDEGNAADHLEKPLPPNTIKALKVRDPAVKKVEQPYASFEGKPMETTERIQTRAAERLRHKNRALTAWDYERLVLEKFPELYKVKCLTKNELKILKESNWDPAAPEVRLVVIPNLTHLQPDHRVEPGLPTPFLHRVKTFIEKQASPFTRVVVQNPRYERVRYRLGVHFYPEYDNAYYHKELNEAIRRFLMPWAYETEADISFGTRIYHSSVIYHIEQLDYVDFVVDFRLLAQYLSTKEPKGLCALDNFSPHLVEAQYPDTILTSDLNHKIDHIPLDQYPPEVYQGIGYQIIGYDNMIKENC